MNLTLLECSSLKPRGRNLFIAVSCLGVLVASLTVYYYYAIPRLANRVELSGLDLGDLDMVGPVPASAEIILIFEVQNPNVLPVYVSSGEFDVFINGQHLAKGDIPSFFVWGGGLQRVAVPVRSSLVGVAMSIGGLLLGGGRITVDVQGTFNVLILSVPFETTLYNATL